MPDAPTNGPTPNLMPGTGPAAGAPDGGGNPNPNPGDGNTTEDGPELSYEELQAEAKKWQDLSRKNEARAKANAEKAKEFDNVASKEWKAAYEREQAAKNATRTPEQIKAEADAAAQAQIDTERAAREEAEANFLRYRLAAGKVPEFAMGLVTGKDEDEINEQVESLTKELETWYQARLATETGPRKPLPNPVAGRTNGVGSTPRELFAQTFEELLNPR